MIITALIIFSLLVFAVFCFRKGAEKEKLKQTTDELKATEDAKKVSDDINRLSNDDVSKQLSKWTR